MKELTQLEEVAAEETATTVEEILSLITINVIISKEGGLQISHFLYIIIQLALLFRRNLIASKMVEEICFTCIMVGSLFLATWPDSMLKIS